MTSPSDSSGNPSGLLLVDGHAYAYRSFHAIPAMTSPGGVPTNALYGFIKAVRKLRDTLKPARVLVVWDGGLAAERLTALPAYKAQRPSMPDALALQIDAIQHWLSTSGSPTFVREGVEADDWIATVASHASQAGTEVVIASPDKDFMQLVGPGVSLYNPNDKTGVLWGEAQVVAKSGVKPGQIVDWLSLIGDAVDNIPGVPGVGPKTATSLLNQFGSVAGIYAGLASLSSERLRLAVSAHREVVERNQALIRLNTRLAGTEVLAGLDWQPSNNSALRDLYENWGFKSLQKEVEESFSQSSLF